MPIMPLPIILFFDYIFWYLGLFFSSYLYDASRFFPLVLKKDSVLFLEMRAEFVLCFLANQRKTHETGGIPLVLYCLSGGANMANGVLQYRVGKVLRMRKRYVTESRSESSAKTVGEPIIKVPHAPQPSASSPVDS